MKKLLIVTSLLVASVLQFGVVGRTNALFEGSSQVACDGIQLAEGATADCTEEPEKVNNALGLVVDIFSLVVGVVAVIMIIIGGLKYVTSNGDANSASSGRNAIIYAIVGIVIVALAQAIVAFTIKRTATNEAAIQAAEEFEDTCRDRARPGDFC